MAALRKLDTQHLKEVYKSIVSGGKISGAEAKEMRRELEKDFEALKKAIPKKQAAAKAETQATADLQGRANKVQSDLNVVFKSFEAACKILMEKATGPDIKKIDEYRIKIERKVAAAKENCKDKTPAEQMKILQGAIKEVKRELTCSKET